MYKRFSDTEYQVDVIMKDGVQGVMDLTDLDFSYGDEGRIRFTIDGIFLGDIWVDLTKVFKFQEDRAVIERVFDCKGLDMDNIYMGAVILMPPEFNHVIVEGLVMNGCVEGGELGENLY